jgi:hypothetical protein
MNADLALGSDHGAGAGNCQNANDVFRPLVVIESKDVPCVLQVILICVYLRYSPGLLSWQASAQTNRNGLKISRKDAKQTPPHLPL